MESTSAWRWGPKGCRPSPPGPCPPRGALRRRAPWGRRASRRRRPRPAPLPGMVVGYKKRAGETVRTGETVVVLEAMKMHNNIEAPCDGTLAELHCREGDSVPKGQPLFRIV